MVAFQRFVIKLSTSEIISGADISRLNDVSEMSDNCEKVLKNRASVKRAEPGQVTLKSDIIAAKVAAGTEKKLPLMNDLTGYDNKLKKELKCLHLAISARAKRNCEKGEKFLIERLIVTKFAPQKHKEKKGVCR